MTITSRRVLLFALALSSVLYAITLTYPFNNDNALYAYMGDLLLHGKAPYAGSWDQNFPGIVFLQAVVILIFGKSQFGFHLWDVGMQLVTSYLVYRIAERLYGKIAGFLAAIFAALFYLRGGLWMAGERDTYVSLLIVLALWLWIRREAKPLFLVGLIAGLTILFRPTYGLIPCAFAASVFFQNKSNKTKAKEVFTLALGSVLPIGLLTLWYLLNGTFNDFWEATILFNLKIYSGSGASFPLWEPIRFYAVAIIPAVFGIYHLLTNRSRDVVVLFLGLFLSGVVSLLVLYRHSIYHYHPAMTIFLIFASIGWCTITDLLTQKLVPNQVSRVRISLLTCLLLFSIWQAFSGNTIKTVLLDGIRGRIHSIKQLYAYYEGNQEYGEARQSELASYLQLHAREDESIQMFGPYSYPQYASGTVTASRFQTIHALTMRGSSGALQDFQERWRKEFLHSLDSVHPKFFIVCDAPEAFRQYYGGRLGHEILREDFIEAGRWLGEHYNRDTVIGAFTVYALKG